MQEAIPTQLRFVLPLWGRMGLAALMFLVAVLAARKAFLKFEWVPWLCLGIFWLINFPRRKGEPIRAYLKTGLRAVASFAFGVAAVIGSGYNLYVWYTK
jgi:hypothetical protein